MRRQRRSRTGRTKVEASELKEEPKKKEKELRMEEDA